MTTTLQERSPSGPVASVRETPRRRAARVLRPARTPAGVAVALTMSAGFSLVAAEVLATLTGGGLDLVPVDATVAMAAGTSWSDPALMLGAMGVAAVGVVLLGLALVPGRCRMVALETADARIVMAITRTGLRRTLKSVAEDVDGVRSVRVRLRRRLIEVTVVSEAERSGEMLRRTGAAVGERLNGLGAMCAGEVVVRLRRKGL
ncbi:DUF6286 domain-containing protein [Nonomuraea sp. NPDC059194]|uniref:DUF6286 domain-containing protein n=1 Tax=Nonomuraea sp. NPDC059194 TaxID=3346764 RepID=UPI00368879F0